MAEHEELENEIAALLLGSVEPGDEPRLRAHLLTCDTCRELAARLSLATAALPLAPDPVEPPSGLRERVLAAAAAVRPDGAPAPSRPPAVASRPLRLPHPGWSLRPAAVAIAAAAFVLGAGLGLGVGHALPAGPSGPTANQPVDRHQLTGTGSMAGVQASAVRLVRDGVTVVDFKGLPQPQPGHVYELWLITDAGQARRATVFTPDGTGSAALVLTQHLQGIRSLAVTVEPGPDGSPLPTQQPELAGRIS